MNNIEARDIQTIRDELKNHEDESNRKLTNLDSTQSSVDESEAISSYAHERAQEIVNTLKPNQALYDEHEKRQNAVKDHKEQVKEVGNLVESLKNQGVKPDNPDYISAKEQLVTARQNLQNAQRDLEIVADMITQEQLNIELAKEGLVTDLWNQAREFVLQKQKNRFDARRSFIAVDLAKIHLEKIAPNYSPELMLEQVTPLVEGFLTAYKFDRNQHFSTKACVEGFYDFANKNAEKIAGVVKAWSIADIEGWKNMKFKPSKNAGFDRLRKKAQLVHNNPQVKAYITGLIMGNRAVFDDAKMEKAYKKEIIRNLATINPQADNLLALVKEKTPDVNEFAETYSQEKQQPSDVAEEEKSVSSPYRYSALDAPKQVENDLRRQTAESFKKVDHWDDKEMARVKIAEIRENPILAEVARAGLSALQDGEVRSFDYNGDIYYVKREGRSANIFYRKSDRAQKGQMV